MLPDSLLGVFGIVSAGKKSMEFLADWHFVLSILCMAAVRLARQF